MAKAGVPSRRRARLFHLPFWVALRLRMRSNCWVEETMGGCLAVARPSKARARGAEYEGGEGGPSSRSPVHVPVPVPVHDFGAPPWGAPGHGHVYGHSMRRAVALGRNLL